MLVARRLESVNDTADTTRRHDTTTRADESMAPQPVFWYPPAPQEETTKN
jgi:hypothetical protein